MGEQNKVVQKNCKIIGSDNIINGSNVTVKIDMVQGDGEKHEIWLKGNLMSLESSTEIPYGNTTHCLEIVQREKDKIKKDELDALRTSFNHINAGSQLMPCQKTLEKENKSMTVKIKKQPVEITLEELKQGVEFEQLRIHINDEKKEEIEKKYGICFKFMGEMRYDDAEITFRENYMRISSLNSTNIPYEIIEKIEVVEKW